MKLSEIRKKLFSIEREIIENISNYIDVDKNSMDFIKQEISSGVDAFLVWLDDNIRKALEMKRGRK